jgi:hypothetical protein
MAKDPDNLAGSFETENTGGLLSGFLAEEDHFDRRALWRLGSWGVGAVVALLVALLANQSSIGWRREELAAADLARQSQQIQSIAKESQNETRRLASAIDTLNGDRDRLYSRVTVLEQGLDSVTGAIARQKNSAAASPPAAPVAAAATPAAASATPMAVATAALLSASQNANPPPVIGPVATTAERPHPDASVPEPNPSTVASVGQGTANTAATTPAATPTTPLMASKSIMAPPDAAAGKLIEPEAPAKAAVAAAAAPAPAPEVVASAPPADSAKPDAVEAATTPQLEVQRTEFAVDVGGANSVSGLRALWRGLLKWRSNAPLAALHPIIIVKEGNTGLGMQLRLAAGPLSDAAAAAKICAVMIENKRTCETTVFDGQRLAMKADDDPPVSAATAKPASTKPAVRPAWHKHSYAKRVTNEEPAKKPEAPPTPSTLSTLSSYFGRH